MRVINAYNYNAYQNEPVKKVRAFHAHAVVIDYFLSVDYLTSQLLVDYRLVDGSLRK